MESTHKRKWERKKATFICQKFAKRLCEYLFVDVAVECGSHVEVNFKNIFSYFMTAYKFKGPSSTGITCDSLIPRHSSISRPRHSSISNLVSCLIVVGSF